MAQKLTETVFGREYTALHRHLSFVAMILCVPRDPMLSGM